MTYITVTETALTAKTLVIPVTAKIVKFTTESSYVVNHYQYVHPTGSILDRVFYQKTLEQLLNFTGVIVH